VRGEVPSAEHVTETLRDALADVAGNEVVIVGGTVRGRGRGWEMRGREMRGGEGVKMDILVTCDSISLQGSHKFLNKYLEYVWSWYLAFP
jgi:hypothetical protein